ncbi:TSC complex subunit tuberin isoform X2 [Lycorma delicatula]|uniref:TSC complex subunit tuberin isoform X2 n=1 Tax=Lycorma delicatula TaxID=130591 RepID=UPI003F518D7D
MSSKDKDSKTMEKLKQFFRLNKGGGGNYKSREDFILTSELEKEISPESSMNHRLKALRELSDHVVNHKLEDSAIEKLWLSIQDLLQENVAQEHRHVAFSFLRFLVSSQYERLNMMRVHFFNLVKNNTEDVIPRLELLVSLTDHGRDILYIEEDIGPFLLNWMAAVVEAGRSTDLLAVMVNVIKYNAAYIDEEIIHGLVQNACFLCCHSPSEQVVLGCLNLLDTVICYSNLPPESLLTFITALCHTVNVEAYCVPSWKIMRNVLGTHMGHSSISTMSNILKDKASLQEPGLLRGAIFYITMGLWTNKRVLSLKCTPTSVLPAFIMALECKHPAVMFEVMISVQCLVKKSGLELQDPCWSICLSMIDRIVQFIDSTNFRVPAAQIASYLHDTLNTIEQLIELGQFNGNVQSVFDIIEKCSSKRPEASVLRLINYLSTSITPTRLKWIEKLHYLVERFYKQETRSNIRIKAIDVLSSVFQSNRFLFEKDLLEKVVLVHLSDAHLEQDCAVRTAVAQLLVDLCTGLHLESVHFPQLMDIIEKMLTHPFTQFENKTGIPGLTEQDCQDVKILIHGMVKMFTAIMFHSPAANAVRVFQMLLTHLELHYNKPIVFEQVPAIRCMVFECLVKLRANSEYRLGFPDASGKPKFSPFLRVDHHGLPPSPMPVSASYNPYYLSLSSACKAIVTCVRQELNWKVLLLILQEIPQVMKNRALILSHQSNDIDLLAAALCSMVTEKTLNENLYGIPPKFTRSDFHRYVFPVLASLASHHARLEPSLQQKLIKCLEYGLASRSARECVMALTVCTLEMRDAMVKLLPEVLLNLSKITATVYIAIPMLEFLSTLTRLPKVFSSFVGDQYMSVFAISLPYTNPFKYNHYTVSLAHHVIAVWFLKCRLPFRRDFVKFIIKGLRANVLLPFEEDQRMKAEYVNEDSSNRKRSSSLTEQGSRRRERPISGSGRLDNRPAVADLKPQVDEALMAFHRELTETCIDLMVRYTYSTCSAMPKRLPTAEFFLSGGQSVTWLLGNKLVTVTTSGCSQKPLKHGLCDRCTQFCRIEKDHPISPTSEVVSDTDRRAPHGKHLPLSRSTSNDITPQSSSILASNNSTAASSPSEEVKRGLESGLTEPESGRMDQVLYGVDRREPQLCACWCQGWAEIYVRRPTGDMSWVMRLQNQPQTLTSPTEFLLNDIATLLFPSLNKKSGFDTDINVDLDDEGLCNGVTGLQDLRQISDPVSIPCSPVRRSPSRNSSRDSVDTLGDDDPDLDDGRPGRSRNPVKRSNSSPEMSASWKNPFLTGAVSGMGGGLSDEMAGRGDSSSEMKKKTVYTKDLRVNCEAIPEEIGGLGSTPPSASQSILTQTAGDSSKDSDTTTQSVAVSHTDVKPITADTKTQPEMSVKKAYELTQSVSSPAVGKGIQDKSNPLSSGKSAGVNESGFSSSISNIDLTNQKSGFTPLNPTPSHLISKPPLSPPPSQHSPRLQPKTMKDQDPSRPDPTSLPPLSFRRDRVYTISVMSPVMRKPRNEWESSVNKSRSPRAKEPPRSGVNPSFVFLQLYHNACFGNPSEKPLLLSNTQVVQRAVKNLDWIKPYETHKIGVIYVGPGQANNEGDILKNQYGSVRYSSFLQNLGTFIKLSDIPEYVFLGGLDKNGNDGKFSYIWEDDVMQVMFHVATLMPLKENDPQCNGKKLHIGNDYVTIVYNESGEDYNIRTVKGQFNYACVVVQPLEHDCNEVMVKAKEELVQHIGHSEPKIVSDKNVSILARQLALHANLASMISRSLSTDGSDPYASNWLERLRQIKRIRNKVLQEMNTEVSGVSSANGNQRSHSSRRMHMDDFTEYT